MGATSREAILQAQDLEYEVVPVPEWGGELFVWRMPEKRRNDFDQWAVEVIERKDYATFRARLIADCAGDEAGKLLFSHDDIAALMEKSSAVVRRVADVALRVNKMRSEDVENEVKNSAGDPGGDSP
jgi:hypothetical protein